jgi:hypothetical protein
MRLNSIGLVREREEAAGEDVEDATCDHATLRIRNVNIPLVVFIA